MSVKVFIDGSAGTTGLRIADRLAARPEIELLSISEEGRKDVNERAKVINSADLAFLCLPDAASKEVMPLLRPDVKVLDTSTAFRTDPNWVYGFPELRGQKEKIKNACRVAVPGCYASGFISIMRPLVELGLAGAGDFYSCTGISGYSGGGKKMIADYESPDRPAHSKLDAPKSYGLSLAHKHLPEMQKISGLANPPAFVPVVCDYYSGMQVLVPFQPVWGGAEKVAEAGGMLVGGHSIADTGVKYGLSVTGLVDPHRLTANDTGRPGDKLLLTKALGVGLICTANRVGEAAPEQMEAAVRSMTTLNKAAAEIARRYEVHAATDVTGFSFLGHLHEMMGEKLSSVIDANAVPILPGAWEAADACLYTAAGQRNRNHTGPFVRFEKVPFPMEEILFDPQTSGGLLFAVAPQDAAALEAELQAAGLPAKIVGTIGEKQTPEITVTYE